MGGMDLTATSTGPWRDAALETEQAALRADRCLLLRPRARPLRLIKATSTGACKLGDVVQVYDSPRTRDLALLGGFLPCEGQTFDVMRWPELRAWLGNDRIPTYDQPEKERSLAQHT